MNNQKNIRNSEVNLIFDKYPEDVKSKMQLLRSLIFDSAAELDLNDLQETLKWGEPSYVTKHGSTLRVDWKEHTPNQYAMYFQCTSKLVPTFRIVYKDILQFEGNRAIIFKNEDQLPTEIIKKCIGATLTYHKIKHLPLLGL